MRYGNAFIWSDIDQRKLANAIATVNHDEMEDSVIENASKYSQRKSKNFWINHPKVLEDFMVIAKRVNKDLVGTMILMQLNHYNTRSIVQRFKDIMIGMPTNIQNHMMMVELERLVFQFC